MMMWMWLSWLACTGPVQTPEVLPPPRPSVVVVVVDTLRRDRLSTYGHDRPTSPNLTRLAAQGVRYDHAVSQAPWTKPSVASLLTSRFPSELGLVGHPTKLSPAATLLPERLKDAGYATGAVVSHSYVASLYGFDQGYDSFDETQVGGEQTTPAEAVTDRAIAFLDAHPTGPVFLFVHYFDPHFAYVQRDGFAFSDAPEGYDGPVRSGLEAPRLRRVLGKGDAADQQEVLRLYDTEIAATDKALGRLLDRLSADPSRADTMVVVTADHGEEFLEHGRWGHTTRLWDELVRVPLVVRYPDGHTGVESSPVALLDVVPTVLTAVGLPVPDGLSGQDLRTAAPDRLVFSETAADQRKDAVVSGSLKLIHDHRGDGWRLFDRESDPAEREDVGEARPEDLARLKAALKAWRGRMREGSGESEGVEVDAEERRRLEALGYVE